MEASDRLSTRDISEAKNPDMRGSLAALKRVAQMARETAIQTNTAIVIVRDGKLVWITADELRSDKSWMANQSTGRREVD